MKITSDKWQVASDTNRQPARSESVFSCHPSPVTRHSQRGVALIITLILLSMTLVMSLAFLAISSRERNSVTTQTDTATTRLAADAGLAAAEAQIAANILSSTNPFSFGLIVSTNYAPYLPPFNVQYLATNLFISPRTPVAVPNPTNPSAPLDFRFYLDLNRNGADDPNGWVPNFDNNGNPIGTSFQVGDPEWIGVLEHPDQPYGPKNPFIARFAFIALPVGNSLDFNAIHNQALSPAASRKGITAVNPPPLPAVPPGDWFFRNQGVGSWEINLAAFLADLDVNEWGQVIGNSANGNPTYYYYQYPPGGNQGVAFYDADALLAFRYANNYHSLAPVGGTIPVFPPPLFTTAFSFLPFQSDIDAFSDGPLQTTTAGINEGGQSVAMPWAGADNTNHYFAPEELFNTNETASFGINLLNAGTNAFGGTTAATYDRYTFYRMLSQLGTDTTPESGKMNLNYDNLDPGLNGFLNTNGTASATNFVAWQPLAFFTDAADRMLKAYTAQWAVNYIPTNSAPGVTNLMAALNTNFMATFNVTAPFGLTNIPVLVSNQFVYTPSVQRVLQLAANLYDASTNSYFPSVFRPVFSRDTNSLGQLGMGTNLYISGYAYVPSVAGTGDPQLATPVDAAFLATTNIAVTNFAVNVYGVPWIIGAKKGFPNFNEFVQENIVGITRRLNVTRDTNYEIMNFPKIRTTGTNQMYILSLNSSLGLDFWNSYSAGFMDNVTVVYRGSTQMTITDDDPGFGAHPGITQPMGFAFANTNYSGPAYFPPTFWPGTSPWSPSVQNGGSGQPNASSFITPLNVNAYPVLTNSVYRTPFAGATPGTLPPLFTGPCLIPTNYFYTLTMPVLFETNTPGFPLPHFGLLTTNRLQVFILDFTNNSYFVIDYAHFEQNNSRNLNAEIFTDLSNNAAPPVGIWNTNIDARTGVPFGVENQISISKGMASVDQAEDGIWQGDAEATLYGNTSVQQQASFQAFFQPYGRRAVAPGWGGYLTASASNTLGSVQAPYAPTRYAVGYTILQANDPLVHYLASDLVPSYPPGLLDIPLNYNNSISDIPPLTSITEGGLSLGLLNNNYQPWGGNPVWSYTGQDTNAYNMAERDPLVSQSDYWAFPTNKFPTTGWVGRVHRGTPWQTVFLKSTNVLSQPNGFNTWAAWTGNQNPFDAANASPVTDRLLFDLFTAAFNDNATRGTLSVNQSADQYDPDGNTADINPAAGLAAWSALFSGMVVPPNNPTNSYTVIAPAGVAGLNSPLGTLVTNINYTRGYFINADGLTGVFEHEGDILSVPQLTDQSSFVDPGQTNYNSDAMYEWLPQQAMSLLRVGTPRYVIYSYGQALKPAPNGIYLGNTTLPNGQSAFGLVTNYQVMSAIATRAVVRIQTVRTNVNGSITETPPRAVIESFNILPPD